VQADAICNLGDCTRLVTDLYKSGYSDKIICIGNYVNSDFKALGINYTSSERSRKYFIENGVPEPDIILINEGDDQLELIDLTINYCKSQGIDTIIITLRKFDTWKFYHYYKPIFDEGKIKAIIVGESNSSYNPDQWWKYEYGIIDVYNAYLSLIYHLVTK